MTRWQTGRPCPDRGTRGVPRSATGAASRVPVLGRDLDARSGDVGRPRFGPGPDAFRSRPTTAATRPSPAGPLGSMSRVRDRSRVPRPSVTLPATSVADAERQGMPILWPVAPSSVALWSSRWRSCGSLARESTASRERRVRIGATAPAAMTDRPTRRGVSFTGAADDLPLPEPFDANGPLVGPDLLGTPPWVRRGGATVLHMPYARARPSAGAGAPSSD